MSARKVKRESVPIAGGVVAVWRAVQGDMEMRVARWRDWQMSVVIEAMRREDGQLGLPIDAPLRETS